MSVSFEDFLKSAEILLDNTESKEIDFRNLISRSYYAAFHLSQEISSSWDIPISKEEYGKLGSHEQVIVKFDKNSDKSLKKFAYYIRQRKKKRVQADYKINEDITRVETVLHLDAVKTLIKELKSLKTNP
jgi:uncharacterized protein (UPF0332 family)